VVYVLTLPGH